MAQESHAAQEAVSFVKIGTVIEIINIITIIIIVWAFRSIPLLCEGD
jgi:hypothetical protein